MYYGVFKVSDLNNFPVLYFNKFFVRRLETDGARMSSIHRTIFVISIVMVCQQYLKNIANLKFSFIELFNLKAAVECSKIIYYLNQGFSEWPEYGEKCILGNLPEELKWCTSKLCKIYTF